MGRAPIYKLMVLRQVTLRDVYARAADVEHGLDVDAFITQALPEPSGDRDADLVKALFASEETLEEAAVGPIWQKLSETLRTCEGGVLAHAANPAWSRFAGVAARHKGIDHLLQPVGVRTLRTTVQKAGWDHQHMPSATLGASSTFDALVGELREMIARTVGGEEYLGSDEVSPARAVTVLATTLAAVLLDEAAAVTDESLRARVLRVDIYEQAVEGAGLGDCFQVIRRLLEMHHDDHIRVPVNGPHSELRDFGFIEYEGKKKQYMKLDTRAAKRWLDPALYK